MEIKDAREFISSDRLKGKAESQWADLGCGSGVFTYALAGLLAERSIVYAVDKRNVLAQRQSVATAKVQFQQADFENDVLDVPPLDGILMANSLHFVQKKLIMVNRLSTILKPDGVFLIIEYETAAANQWVPFPLIFSAMSSLFMEAGFNMVEKISERPSLYNAGTMYAAIARRK